MYLIFPIEDKKCGLIYGEPIRSCKVEIGWPQEIQCADVEELRGLKQAVLQDTEGVPTFKGENG